MNTVIELGERAVEVPGEREADVFVLLESLELFDEVELELHRNPGGEFEGDVLVGEGAAVPAWTRDHSNGAGGVNPLRWS